MRSVLPTVRRCLLGVLCEEWGDYNLLLQS